MALLNPNLLALGREKPGTLSIGLWRDPISPIILATKVAGLDEFAEELVEPVTN
jgi:hypothetical protein